ncbi:hypothetical protein D3C81_2033320 [compost metagenome]
MSEMEYNKGVLIPTHIDTEHFGEDEYDTYRELDGFEVIDGEIYEVNWEIRRGTLEDGFARVTTKNNGEIHFETYHYNGGAHWTEVVENKL